MVAWRRKHRTILWLERLVVVIVFQASCSVQATVESVPPKIMWCASHVVPPDCTYTADIAAGQAQSDGQNAWPYVVASGTKFVLVSCDGNGTCSYKTLQYGTEVGGLRYFFVRHEIACPVPSTNPTVPYTYKPTTGMCERPSQCQPPDAIDPATGQCAQCPVAKLTNPPFSDACSTSLEASKGFAPESTCGKLRDDMIKAAACITTKINALSTPRINYTGPSATIRTAEYQDHLRETWDKSAQLSTIMNSPVFTPATKQACVQRKLDIDAHKESHKLRERPSSAGDAAPHVEKRAIDISQAIVDSMAAQVNVYTTKLVKVNGKIIPQRILTSGVEEYINSKTINPSPECNISPYIDWGGNFKPDDDPVHFQLK